MPRSYSDPDSDFGDSARFKCGVFLFVIGVFTIFILAVYGWSDCVHHAHGLPNVIECAKHGDSSAVFSLVIFGISMLILLWIIVFVLFGAEVSCSPCIGCCYLGAACANCFCSPRQEQEPLQRNGSIPQRMELGLACNRQVERIPWWNLPKQIKRFRAKRQATTVTTPRFMIRSATFDEPAPPYSEAISTSPPPQPDLVAPRTGRTLPQPLTVPEPAHQRIPYRSSSRSPSPSPTSETFPLLMIHPYADNGFESFGGHSWHDSEF